VYDAKTFEVKWQYFCQAPDDLIPDRYIFSLAFSPDGQLIATGDGGGHGDPGCPHKGTVRIYCTSTGEVHRALNGTGALSVKFSPTGDIIAAGHYDGTVQLIDVATGEVKGSLSVSSEDHGGYVTSIDFAPCGTKIAAVSNIFAGFAVKEGGVKILNPETDCQWQCQ